MKTIFLNSLFKTFISYCYIYTKIKRNKYQGKINISFFNQAIKVLNEENINLENVTEFELNKNAFTTWFNKDWGSFFTINKYIY